MRGIGAALLAATLLAACATTPPAPAPVATFDAVAAVSAIRAAGNSSSDELVVRSLGDPQVEDLRQQAVQLQAEGRHPDAAAVLDHALAISPADPRLLQERAEAALLLGDFAAAEAHARRADAIGSQVGPLCRRHWTTVEQARLAAGDRAGADAARARVDACRVDRPARY